ncbi:MAG: hypothetical protein K6A41_08555 [Bacteroidales bacterium]|nr:hypothetical protein [Bacteroidales bacterium]
MKPLTLTLLLLAMIFSGFAQDDWCGFNRFKADNERIIQSGDFPSVVFMGNSITEYWAYYHPEFFSQHNYCGRGIGGQTSAQMLMRFTADVIDLHPKAVVIMAGTNDVAHNDYWVEPDKVVDNVIAMCLLAKANNIVPIISSIPPCNSFVWNPDIQNAGQTIVDINKKLKNYADNNGITYIDYHSALTDEHNGFQKNLSDDGCHPNPDTYFIMERIVGEAIGRAMKS